MDFSGLECALFLDIYSRGYMRGRILCFFLFVCVFGLSSNKSVYKNAFTLYSGREREIYIHFKDDSAAALLLSVRARCLREIP